MQELLEHVISHRSDQIPNNEITSILSNTSAGEIGLYLESILGDEKKLMILKESSYIHQLGFEKYVLLPNIEDNHIGIRLHYWDRDVITPFANEIHDHCHNFTSKILIGSLSHIFYKCNKVGREYSLFKYELNSHTRISRQIYYGNVGVEKTGELNVIQGETYSLDAEQLHSVKVDTPFAVSLLVQGVKEKTDANVFKALNQTNQAYESIGVGKLSTEQIKHRLKVIANLLMSSK